MSDKANCKNCIHFDEIKRRCCLNDDSWVQKECYFKRNNRKPMGNDVIFEKQGEIIKDLQSQLDRQKAMWNELKEWLVRVNQVYMNAGFFDCAGEICEVIDKMQELEGKDVKD